MVIQVYYVYAFRLLCEIIWPSDYLRSPETAHWCICPESVYWGQQVEQKGRKSILTFIKVRAEAFSSLESTAMYFGFQVLITVPGELFYCARMLKKTKLLEPPWLFSLDLWMRTDIYMYYIC